MTAAPELIARVPHVRVQALHRGRVRTGSDHVLGPTSIARGRKGQTLIALVLHGQTLIGRARQDRVMQATNVRRVRVSTVNGRIGVRIATGLDGHDRTASVAAIGFCGRSNSCQRQDTIKRLGATRAFFFKNVLRDAGAPRSKAIKM